MDATRPERLGSERGGERRVDASGDADHDVAEAVLLHVVAEPELESEPHLVELVERRRQLARRPLVEVDDEQSLLEAGRSGDDLALGVEDERVPVEDELVLAADGVAEDERAAVVPRPRREHLLALRVLADVERRRGEVDEDLRACLGALDGGRAGLPDVLADRQSESRLAVLEQHDVRAGLEVALLVEHAVVRQQPLAVDGTHVAVGAHEARVVEPAVCRVRRADERDDARGRLRHLARSIRRRADERGAEQQVLRRIARDRELGKDDELGARVACLLDPLR